MKMSNAKMWLLSLLQLVLLYSIPSMADMVQDGSTCTVTPSGGKDDSGALVDAFKKCGTNGVINVEPGDYTIAKVMDTTLNNAEVNIRGKLTWPADDISYWTRNSIGVTYAQRSTAWRIGGDNFKLLGHGQALFYGDGQKWYDANRNGSNMQGRPISLTLWNAKNAIVDGITWRQPQFWHTFVAHSQNITMTNLDMNATSSSQWNTVNTDGFDSWNSKDLVLKNWVVTCGDDCISVKGNSTNVYVKNVTCYRSGAMCVGSLGNPASTPDYVENVLFEDIRAYHSSNAAWLKTYPGQGHVKNVTFRNIYFEDVNQPIYISSCIYSYSNCDSSRLKISDVTWENITGTSRYNVAAGIHCSAGAPCENLKFSGIDIKPKAGGSAKYLCSNFNTKDSGLPCTESCPGSWEQQLKGNH